MPVGVDVTQTEFNEVEKTSGEKAHKLTISELPKSSIKIPHVAYYNDCAVSDGGWTQSGREQMEKEGVAQDSTNEGWHIMSIGENQPHNNVQPSITCYMWKRTA